jgi:hypothetical protein
MAAPTRTPEQRERDLERTADMYCRGFKHSDIAREIGVSRTQIVYDLKEIRSNWLTSQVRDFNEAKEEELKKLDALEQEAWDAWRRSQTERTRTVTEKTEGDSSGRIKAQQTKETGYGDPRFLTVVQSCIDKRCKILGVEAPKSVELTGKDGKPLQVESAVRIYLPSNGRDVPMSDEGEGVMNVDDTAGD